MFNWRHPLSAPASRAVIACSGALSAAALIAGAVRILPWLLDPNVPARVALPFARGVAELAIEAAVLVGWPLGWALAAHRFAERGEARAMMLLGESPAKAALAQWRSAIPAAFVLAIASALGAMDASAPGRMAQDLITQGRDACAHVVTPSTYSVPFVDATWLCTPGSPPRLYGASPGPLHAVVFTATDARIAGDMRRIELDDARFSWPSKAFPIDVHAKEVVLRGLSPWAHASNVPAPLRAFIVVAAAAAAALLAAHACLTRMARGTFAAVLVGVSGPVAALGLMRAMERAGAPVAAYLVTPIVAAIAVSMAALLAVTLRRPRA